MSPLDREHIGVERIEPGDPLTQIEAVRLDGGAGVAGQEPSQRPSHLIAKRTALIYERDGIRGGGSEHSDLLSDSEEIHTSTNQNRSDTCRSRVGL